VLVALEGAVKDQPSNYTSSWWCDYVCIGLYSNEVGRDEVIRRVVSIDDTEKKESEREKEEEAYKKD